MAKCSISRRRARRRTARTSRARREETSSGVISGLFNAPSMPAICVMDWDMVQMPKARLDSQIFWKWQSLGQNCQLCLMERLQQADSLLLNSNQVSEAMRDKILSEIRRLTAERSGVPPGRILFERETSIRPSAWRGIYWARWTDAVVEAGFEPNAKQGKLDRSHLIEKLVASLRHYGRIPTAAELKMYRREVPDFPSHSTLLSHFGGKEGWLDALEKWAHQTNGNQDIIAFLSERSANGLELAGRTSTADREGMVYLIRSGSHFKIGRSEQLERRVKEIRISLPEAMTLEHAIRTDDPAGIEAYWHRRFADRRANGEWFRLSKADVVAFKRRKFQ